MYENEYSLATSLKNIEKVERLPRTAKPITFKVLHRLYYLIAWTSTACIKKQTTNATDEFVQSIQPAATVYPAQSTKSSSEEITIATYMSHHHCREFKFRNNLQNPSKWTINVAPSSSGYSIR